MKKLIRISAFSILAFLFLTSAIQKKQTQNILGGHYTEGTVDLPEPIPSHANPIWHVYNYTDCEFNLNLWFSVNNKTGTYDINLKAKEHKSFTTNDLRNLWDLVGQDLIFTNLSGNLYSVEHGHSFDFYPGTKTYQYSGDDGPCSCIIIDYNYATYTITINKCP